MTALIFSPYVSDELYMRVCVGVAFCAGELIHHIAVKPDEVSIVFVVGLFLQNLPKREIPLSYYFFVLIINNTFKSNRHLHGESFCKVIDKGF